MSEQNHGPGRWIAAAIAFVVLLGVGALVVSRGADEPGTSTATRESTGSAGTPVVLEPIGFPGEDPFALNMTVREVAAFPTDVRAVIDATIGSTTRSAPPAGAGGSPGIVRIGTTPGLYGGTKDEQACDPAQLVDFLATNPDKAAIWASTQGLAGPDAIADFVAALTPAVLTTDTWVTNHGYADGAATPYQAVLQAGTAVLVDDTGLPRVKCSCGNPLLRPSTAGPSELADTTGTRWPAYDPSAVSTTEPGDAVTELSLTDTTTGATFTRPVGVPRAVEPNTADPSAVDLRSVDWDNATYPPGSCAAIEEGFTLVDGALDLTGRPTGVGIPPSIALEEVVYGDLTGDGLDDAAVAVFCSGGGSGQFTSVAVFTGGPEGPLPLGTITPRSVDRGFRGVAIVDGQVAIDGLVPGPSEGLCCPTVPAPERWRWDGSALVAVGTADPGLVAG